MMTRASAALLLLAPLAPLAPLASPGKVPFTTDQLRGFYTERICGTVFTDRCRAASTRIVCGQDYCAQLAPYHAVLDIKGSAGPGRGRRQAQRVIDTALRPDTFMPFCGATLISEQWLVTAAHCVHANREGEGYCLDPQVGATECRTSCPPGCHRVLPEQLQVYVGLTDVTELAAAQARDVEAIIIHPGWDLATKDNDILAGHDIALIRLASEVALSDVVWPACLPDPLLSLGLSEVGADVSVVGFGTTNTTTKAWADVLQMANIKVVSSSSCYSTAASSFLWSIKGDQICARGEEMEPSRRCFRDSCQGDSGGALISSNFGRKFLVGVVSFGETFCGGLENPRPGVYTNITAHVHWIREVWREYDGGGGRGWSAWSEWGACSVGCGTGQRNRTRTCSRLARTSEPALGYVVGAECNDETTGVQNCNEGDCSPPPPGPGMQLINGITGIFGGLGTVILGIPPGPHTTTGPPPGEAPLPTKEVGEECPAEGCAVKEEVDWTCVTTCTDWPFSQCNVELRRTDGSWQAATCLHPFISRPGPFTPFPQKFTNYPECGQVPVGCARCDDHCARADGKAGKEDY